MLEEHIIFRDEMTDNNIKWLKRRRQDLNLRVNFTVDFKSTPVTTWVRRHLKKEQKIKLADTIQKTGNSFFGTHKIVGSWWQHQI